MEFQELLQRRRSVRRYDDRPIEQDKLDYVLESARIAPSTGNRQSASFIVVQDKDTITRIGKPYAMYNKWLPSAPAIIVACGDKMRAMSHHGVHFWEIDASIATEHLVLAATDVGLVTCWIGLFHTRAVRRALRIPPHIRVLALLAIGYPAASSDGGAVERVPRPHNRKPMTEFAHWEMW